jgi:hypothetical protein
VHRTQEVGGSSPPSSIVPKPLHLRAFHRYRGARARCLADCRALGAVVSLRACSSVPRVEGSSRLRAPGARFVTNPIMGRRAVRGGAWRRFPAGTSIWAATRTRRLRAAAAAPPPPMEDRRCPSIPSSSTISQTPSRSTSWAVSWPGCGRGSSRSGLPLTRVVRAEPLVEIHSASSADTPCSRPRSRSTPHVASRERTSLL